MRLTVETRSIRSGWSDWSSPGSYSLYTALAETPPLSETRNHGTICQTEHNTNTLQRLRENQNRLFKIHAIHIACIHTPASPEAERDPLFPPPCGHPVVFGTSSRLPPAGSTLVRVDATAQWEKRNGPILRRQTVLLDKKNPHCDDPTIQK